MTPVIIQRPIIRRTGTIITPGTRLRYYYGDTVVRSGVRYSDAYGPRYYRTRTVYGDW